jgi:hypothetical protein
MSRRPSTMTTSLSVAREMRYKKLFFVSLLRRPVVALPAAGENEEKQLKKKQSLPAGHRMKKNPVKKKT